MAHGQEQAGWVSTTEGVPEGYVRFTWQKWNVWVCVKAGPAGSYIEVGAVPPAENLTSLVDLIGQYQRLAGVPDPFPPITLWGPGWDKRWESICRIEGVAGNAGPDWNSPDQYQCFVLCLPKNPRGPEPGDNPGTLEGTIAHEMAHLRWWDLREGPEFEARVGALLRGAQFPPPGGRWSQRTILLVKQERERIRTFWQRRLEELAQHREEHRKEIERLRAEAETLRVKVDP